MKYLLLCYCFVLHGSWTDQNNDKYNYSTNYTVCDNKKPSTLENFTKEEVEKHLSKIAKTLGVQYSLIKWNEHWFKYLEQERKLHLSLIMKLESDMKQLHLDNEELRKHVNTLTLMINQWPIINKLPMFNQLPDPYQKK